MPDAATFAVIRDIAAMAIFALLFGTLIYAGLRRLAPYSQWNYQGNVLSRPYGRADGIAAVLLIAFLTANLFSSALAGSADESLASATASNTEKLVGLVTNMSFSLLFALLLLVYLRLIRDLDPIELFGLRLHSISKTIMFAVIGLAVAYASVLLVNVVATLLLDGVWPDVGAQDPVQAFQQAGSLSFKILLGIYAVIIAPLVEEIMFRGFLYGVIKRFTDSYFAALVTALLFGVVHLHVASFAPLCALGIVLAVAYEVTGSLLVPMGIHALFNTVNLVLMVVEPAGS